MTGASEQPTILVVDDERGPRESLRMILAPRFRVLLAENGAVALDLLRTTPVDVVTLDLNMPGIKGTDLMSTVRREFPDVELVVITGYGTLESATAGIRYGISDYLEKPFDVVQVMASVERALERRAGRHRVVGFLETLGTIVGRDRDAAAIVEEIERSPRLRSQLVELLDRASERGRGSAPSGRRGRTSEFLEVFAETIEAQNPYMRGHARRVAFYSGLLGERLCLGGDELEQVRISAFLHDLGKIGVPTDLVVRAGALDPAERARVERHPEIGARLLEPLGVSTRVVAAIRHHHEWWDGNGYPDGLFGDDIPLAARIIHIADAFDAMTCDRPYRRALPRRLVLRELGRFAGVQFDPGLTKEFLALVEQGACDVDVDVLADVVATFDHLPQAAASERS
jgi:response regulator RpfG family c-di-GMP phosphodiesterase